MAKEKSSTENEEKEIISVEELLSKNQNIKLDKADNFSSCDFWHYTSFEKANLILDNNCFYFRNLAQMNDLKEASLHEKEGICTPDADYNARTSCGKAANANKRRQKMPPFVCVVLLRGRLSEHIAVTQTTESSNPNSEGMARQLFFLITLTLSTPSTPSIVLITPSSTSLSASMTV